MVFLHFGKVPKLSMTVSLFKDAHLKMIMTFGEQEIHKIFNGVPSVVVKIGVLGSSNPSE